MLIRRPPYVFVLIGCSLWLMGGALHVLAAQPQAQRYSFDFRGQPVHTALEGLARVSKINLVYDLTVVEKRTTGCTVTDTEPEFALHCILKNTGLTARRLRSGTYVIRALDAAVLPSVSAERGDRVGVLRGVVVEEEAGLPLAGANVVLVGGQLGAATGPDGTFEIRRVPVGVYVLEASMIGFETVRLERITVADGQTTDVRFALAESPLSLNEVVVTPGFFSLMHRQPTVLQTLSRQEIRRLPHLADDVFRAVVRLPGLASNDFSAGFAVRGGSHEEVLVLLDGMELYEPFHLKSDYGGGFLSILDTEAIGGVDMMTGAFPVEYGDRLSAVFNIDSSSPSSERARTSVGLSFTNLRLLSEGQFADGKGQWLAVGRRGYVDLLLKAIEGEEDIGLNYYDAFARIQYQLDPNHAVAMHILRAEDRVRFEDLDPLNNDQGAWNDFATYGWLTWKATWHPRVLTKTLFSVGTLGADRTATFVSNGSGLLYSTVEDQRTVDFYGVKQDWTLALSDRFLLKWGGELKRFAADYDYQNTVRTSLRFVEGEPIARFDSTQALIAAGA